MTPSLARSSLPKKTDFWKLQYSSPPKLKTDVSFFKLIFGHLEIQELTKVAKTSRENLRSWLGLSNQLHRIFVVPLTRLWPTKNVFHDGPRCRPRLFLSFFSEGESGWCAVLCSGHPQGYPKSLQPAVAGPFGVSFSTPQTPFDVLKWIIL